MRTLGTQLQKITLLMALLILTPFLASCLESRADKSTTSRHALAQQLIVSNRCGTCHTLQAGELSLDGQIGPDLSQEGRRGRSRQWLRRQLTDPKSVPDSEVVAGFEGKQKLMPSFSALTEEELAALIDFLSSLK